MTDEAAHKDAMAIPAILDFVPFNCSVQLNQYHENSVAPYISMGLRLSGGDNVRTPDERSLNDIEWSISIYEGSVTNEHVQSLNAIGMLNYFPGDQGVDYSVSEGCSAWAHLEKGTFALLSSFVLSGRTPSSIRIHAVGGLRHGWEPDGSGKVWDVQANPNSPVQRLEISLVAVETPDEDCTIGVHRPVTAADLQNLEQSLATTISKKTRKNQHHASMDLGSGGCNRDRGSRSVDTAVPRNQSFKRTRKSRAPLNSSVRCDRRLA